MLTIGFLSDDPLLEHWMLDSWRRIRDLPGTCLRAIVLTHGKRRTTAGEGLHGLVHGADNLLRCRGDAALARGDLARLATVPVLGIEARYRGGRWWLDVEACRALQQHAVDVWLCATAHPLSFATCDVARYGAWGVEIGCGVAAASPWAGAIEVAAGSPITAITVRDYVRNSDGGALLRSIAATDRYSATRNRRGAVTKAGWLVERAVRARLDGKAYAAPAALPAGYPSCCRPTAGAAACLGLRLAYNIVTNRLRGLWARPQWQIGYYFGRAHVQSVDPRQLRFLLPPPDRFWADPMPVKHNGRYFIFFEELLFRELKGRLAAVEVFADRAPGEPRVVLERDYHLSYPFLFHWKNELWMIPETGARGRVELYRCTRFPDGWTHVQVLLDGVSGFDATLWQSGEKWWMFVSVPLPGTTDGDELHLYSADEPTGTWAPHPLNPVISDARYARPAGPLYTVGNNLYRPSQDCSSMYGYAVSINRIDALDASTYAETPVAEISPELRDDFVCLHTIGHSGPLKVFDFQVLRRRYSGWT